MGQIKEKPSQAAVPDLNQDQKAFLLLHHTSSVKEIKEKWVEKFQREPPHRNTIRRIIKRATEENSIMSRKYRSGRRRSMRTDAAIQAVLKTLTETNSGKPHQLVPRGRSNPWNISGRTFGRIMKEIGFRAYVVRRYQKLSERNVKSRIQFCREILVKPPSFCKFLCITDEKYFIVQGSFS